MNQTEPYVFDILEALRDGVPLDFHGHSVPEDVQEWCQNNLVEVEEH